MTGRRPLATCEQCKAAFDPRANRIFHNPWLDLLSPTTFSRGQRNLWRWGYVEQNYNRVRCPQCSHIQASGSIRLLGVFDSAKSYRLFQLTILLAFLAAIVIMDLL